MLAEQLTTHAVNQTLESVSAVVRRLSDELDDATRLKVQSIQQFANRVHEFINSADPALVRPSTLDEIHSQINAAVAKLEQYEQEESKNEALIDQAISTVESAIPSASTLIFGLSDPIFSSVGGEVDRFRSDLTDHLKDLRSEVVDLHSEAATITEQVAAAKSTHGTNVESAKEELTDLVKTQREAVAGDVADWRANAEAKIEQLIDRLQDHESKARKSLEATGKYVTTGGHFDAAEKEKDAANRMRLISLVFMGLGIVFVIWQLLVGAGGGTPTWEQLLSRLIILLAIITPAVYAARESAIHRRRERINRKLALELGAIDPYIANLSETQQQDLKKELAEKLLGVQDSEGETGDVVGTGALIKLLEKAMDKGFR